MQFVLKIDVPAETVPQEHSGCYPEYRRRQDGREVQQKVREADGQERTITLTNQHVVPYDRFLSLRYNCHINLEICIGFRAVKYLNNMSG